MFGPTAILTDVGPWLEVGVISGSKAAVEVVFSSASDLVPACDSKRYCEPVAVLPAGGVS
jgi:hypothetical protein